VSAFQFQSLRSSSSGNCLIAWTSRSAILLDCGISTQRGCHALLDSHAGKLSGVVVSHAHGDHICYSSLKVLRKFGTPVHCHHSVQSHIERKHIRERFCSSHINPFDHQHFTIGDFEIHPVPVPHEPSCPTFGFVVFVDSGPARRKMVVCTDFHDHKVLLDHMRDADFVFIEANHDLELLRKYFNYASLFHLSNVKTADLLCTAAGTGEFKPQRVMLGHLSEQRNTDSLAMETVRERFAHDGVAMNFELECAPRLEPSNVIHIE